MVNILVESVLSNGLHRPESLRNTPIVAQSFDEATIRRLAAELPGRSTSLLMDSPTAKDWPRAASRDRRFATGIGPAKDPHRHEIRPLSRERIRRASRSPPTVSGEQSGRFASVREEMGHFLYTLGLAPSSPKS
jgi:hypothetical protein